MDIFDEMNRWEKTEGASIFCSIINVPHPVILDYRCGAGNYSFRQHMLSIRNARSVQLILTDSVWNI